MVSVVPEKEFNDSEIGAMELEQWDAGLLQAWRREDPSLVQKRTTKLCKLVPPGDWSGVCFL
jgi:hypothetical protein